MEPTRSLKRTYHDYDASEDATDNDKRVAPRMTRTEGHRAQGHRFEAVTSQDNARVHMGDVHGGQHTHYHEAPPPHPDAQEISLQDALAFEQMDFRSAAIAPAYAKTCDWLFTASPYKRWRDRDLVSEHNGFLWIKGKPGAGKSTVMKHAWEHARAMHGDEITMSFFFNARGAALGKSVEGMYRCLLHEMVGRMPHFSSKIAAADRDIYQAKGWPVAILQDLFRRAVLDLCRQIRMNCYIDALDEGDDEDQVREMVEFFHELAERALSDGLPFYVCLASRYYPNISVSTFEELRLEDHEGHDTDISDYVHNKLRLRSGRLKKQLASEINTRSRGVFLWVVLVVAILNKEGDRGNQHLLLTRLKEIPDGLLQLFRDLMTRDAPDDRFLPTIQWVLYAVKILTPEELYIAVLTSTGELTAESLVWIRQTIDPEMIRDFILSSSKGFLEIRYGEHWPHDGLWNSHPEVQFIHETVREYFLGASEFTNQTFESDVSKNHFRVVSEPGSRSIDDIAAISHARLSQICQAYIRISHTSDLQQNPQFGHADLSPEELRNRPFLGYAVAMALRHADAASKYGRRVSNLAQEFPREEWTLYCSVTDPFSADDHRRIDTWLQLMTYEGHSNLIKDEISSIRANAKRSRRKSGEFESLLNACARGLGSALHIGARGPPPRCLQLLLDSGADVNMMCEGVGSPLHAAVSSFGSGVSAVELLLEYGADATLVDDRGNSALHYAILAKNLAVIEILASRRGVDLDGRVGVHGNAAQTAGELNDWWFLRALAELGGGVQDSSSSLDGRPDGCFDSAALGYEFGTQWPDC
jgi:hypothetical protein